MLSSAAAAERPVIAVVPFTGPQGKAAEATVVRTLRKKASLIPPTTWEKSSKKLFAATHNPDDIAAVAQDVGAQIVITGVVKRDGRKWQLAVSVRDGKTGRSRDKLKYPLAAPRVTQTTLSLLATEVDAAFDHALAAANGEPAPEPVPPTPPTPPAPPPKTSKGKKIAKSEPEPAPEPEPTPKRDDEPAPIAAREPVATVEAAPPAARPRWAPYVDASIGGSISGRSFDFDPSSQPRFKSGIVGGLRVDLTVYPLAFTWRKAAGVLATLGLGATLEKPFWLDSSSKADPTQHFATTELQVEGGLRWRFVLYKKVPRPELTLLVGGGMHSFSIGKAADGTDVGPADVTYKYMAVGASVRLHFAEWASLWAQFTYHPVFGAGSIQDVAEYGGGSVYGLRVAGGLDFFVWRGLKIGALGYYERYVLTFSGTGTPPPTKVASSAIDQYFGGVLVVGYVY
jgi:hypothetical protein